MNALLYALSLVVSSIAFVYTFHYLATRLLTLSLRDLVATTLLAITTGSFSFGNAAILAGILPPVLVQAAIFRWAYLLITVAATVLLHRVAGFSLLRSEHVERIKFIEQMRTQFIQNASHELRTPLAIASGYVENMLAGMFGELTPPQERALAVTHASCAKLRHIVTLTTTMLEPPFFVRTDINEEINDRLPQWQERATAAGLSLSLSLSDHDTRAYLDRRKVLYALDALIDNAIKYSNEGGQVVVTTKSGRDAIKIVVRDRGIGVTQDYLRRMMVGFVQEDGSDRRYYSGFGLGLAVVSHMVDVHKAGVNIRSRQGIGTTITLTIPRWQSSRVANGRTITAYRDITP